MLTVSFAINLQDKLNSGWISKPALWSDTKKRQAYYAGFRLTCRLPHCRFDDDISSTAQAPLAAEGWPSGKQRQANRSITLPLCPPRQIADSWILFNSGAMPLGDKATAALPLRAATLKQQAMITRHSGKAASGKLVWNQHYAYDIYGKKRERSKKALAAQTRSRLYAVELLKEFSCKSCYTKTKKVRLLNGHKKIS